MDADIDLTVAASASAVTALLHDRRAFRCLEGSTISDTVLTELASAAQLSPSANNHQPWRFVFVRNGDLMTRFRAQGALADFNEWAYSGSMFIAVCGSQADDDVVPVSMPNKKPHKTYATNEAADAELSQRPLFLFDIGIATGFMMLRATELGLVAHPIAGYDEDKVKNLLAIPDAEQVIAMLIVGVHDDDPAAIAELPADMQADERERPARKALSEFAFADRYGKSI